MIEPTILMGGSSWPSGFSGDWPFRESVTVQFGQVAENENDYEAYIRLSDLSATFHANVKSDGSDVRITDTDGVTELPREIVTITTGSSIGEIHVGPFAISATVDKKIYIYYGNSGASEPAVTATYGRNAVWAKQRGVYHLQESDPGADSIVDATGNGYDMTDIGTMVSGDSVAGHIEGQGFQFETSKSQGLLHENHFFSGSPAYPFTLEGSIFSPSGDLDNALLLGVMDKSSGSTYGDLLAVNNPTGKGRCEMRHPTDGTGSAAQTGDSRGAWHRFVGRLKSATDRVFIVDGVQVATSTVSIRISTAMDRMTIGYRGDSSASAYSDGKLDELRFLEIDRSTNYYLTQFRNFNAPATFYTVGAVESL